MLISFARSTYNAKYRTSRLLECTFTLPSILIILSQSASSGLSVNQDSPLTSPADGVLAQGGYSSSIRVHDRWVFTIPEAIKSEDAAPMLCAGLTVYSPLLRNGAGPGKTVGIVGIGGLGRESGESDGVAYHTNHIPAISPCIRRGSEVYSSCTRLSGLRRYEVTKLSSSPTI